MCIEYQIGFLMEKSKSMQILQSKITSKNFSIKRDQLNHWTFSFQHREKNAIVILIHWQKKMFAFVLRPAKKGTFFCGGQDGGALVWSVCVCFVLPLYIGTGSRLRVSVSVCFCQKCYCCFVRANRICSFRKEVFFSIDSCQMWQFSLMLGDFCFDLIVTVCICSIRVSKCAVKVGMRRSTTAGKRWHQFRYTQRQLL